MYQQQGKLDDAISAFRRALQYLPNAPEIHNTLGTALRQKGDMEAARPEFQEPARLNKRKSDILEIEDARLFSIERVLRWPSDLISYRSASA